MAENSLVTRVYRQMARRGGLARAKALTPEDRTRIARMGGRAGGRGRRKEERIPAELAGKIRDLIERTGDAAVWYMSEPMKRPRFRGAARQVLLAIARNGSLDAYKSAHEILKCL